MLLLEQGSERALSSMRVQRVLAAGGTTAAQIAGDPDLESVRGAEWFGVLTHPPAAPPSDEAATAAMPCEE